MGIKEKAEEIEAGKRRLELIEKKKEKLKKEGKEPKLTKQVKTFLLVTNLSLKKAIAKGFVDININTNKYIVTKKGNDYRQKIKRY